MTYTKIYVVILWKTVALFETWFRTLAYRSIVPSFYIYTYIYIYIYIYFQNIFKTVYAQLSVLFIMFESFIIRYYKSVPHPDIFWAYHFLEVKDWIVQRYPKPPNGCNWGTKNIWCWMHWARIFMSLEKIFVFKYS